MEILWSQSCRLIVVLWHDHDHTQEWCQLLWSERMPRIIILRRSNPNDDNLVLHLQSRNIQSRIFNWSGSPLDTNAGPLAHEVDRSILGKVPAPQHRNDHQKLDNAEHCSWRIQRFKATDCAAPSLQKYWSMRLRFIRKLALHRIESKGIKLASKLHPKILRSSI